MKYIYTIILLSIITVSYSQETRNIIGLRGGPTFSVRTANTGETRLSIGLFYTRKFNHVQLTFEPSLNQTGASNNSFGGTIYHYNSYQLATSLGFYTSKKLIAGAYIGFLPGITSEQIKNDLHDRKKNEVTLSGMVGGSLGYNISDKIACYASLRYILPIGEFAYFSPQLFIGYNF
jgi:hypothetical protein